MKKALIVLSISALFAACNDDSTKSTDVTKDSTSTMMSSDASKMAPAMSDTSSKMMTDSSNLMGKDTMMNK
ncbi:MAG: hypothetical protein ABI834_01410 [Ginsengibacter sp.]